MNGVKRMNMGSTNTIEGNMGCPWIDSNQILMIRSLHNSIHNNIQTNQVEGPTETILMDFTKSDPCENNKTDEE
jgi:hypothetical protein